MRTTLHVFSVFVFSICLNVAFAQCPGFLGTGVTTIGSIPYSDLGHNTAGDVDDLTSTNIPNECDANYLGGEDHVYIFAPGASGNYLVSLNNQSSIWGGIQVFEGCPDTAQCVGDATSSSSSENVTVAMSAGKTYYIIADIFASPTTYTYDLLLDLAPPAPTNDTCGGAVAIMCGDTLSGDATSATSVDAMSCSGNSIGEGVWYRLAGFDGTINVTVAPTGWDCEVQVWSGSCGALTCLDRADSGGSGSAETVSNVTVASGTNYYIYVGYWSTSGTTGPFDISVSCSACIPPSFSTSVKNVDCGTSSMLSIDVNVTDTGSGSTVDITNNGGAAAVTNVGTGVQTIGPFALGTTVRVYVADNADPNCIDSVDVALPSACPPPNNNCAGVIDLGTLTSPLSDSSDFATNDYILDCLTNSGAPDMVYKIDVPNGSTLNIGQTSNNYDSKHRLAWGGTCPGDSLIICTDDPDTQQESWVNTTGSTQTVYWVQSAFSTGRGNFTLAWEILQCAGATVVDPPTVDLTNCPTSGDISVTITDLGNSASVDIISDAGINQLGISDTGTYTLTGFAAGADVTITIEHETDTLCDVVLSTVNIACPPANDSCQNATAFPAIPGDGSCATVSGSTAGASNSGFVPGCDFAGGDYHVFFSFVAPAGGSVTIEETLGSASALEVVVLDSCIGGEVSGSCGTLPRTVSGLTPSQTYILLAWNDDFETPGTFDLCLKVPPPPPANDSCENATVLMCDDTLSNQTTLSATGGTSSSCTGTRGDDVWYSFAGNGQNVSVTVTPDPGVFEPQLDIYESSNGTCDSISCIAGDDIFTNSPVTVTFFAANGTTYYIAVGASINGDPGGDFTISVECDPCVPPTFTTSINDIDCQTSSMLSIDVDVTDLGSASTVDITNNGGAPAVTNVGIGVHTIGQFNLGDTVTVYVADNADPTCLDSAVIILSSQCPPTNDLCDNAVVVNCNDSLANQTTIGATGATSNSCTGTIGNNVWFEFEGNNQTVTVTATPDSGDFDIQLDIYEGTCDSLICVDGDDDFNNNPVSVSFAAISGTTYYFNVGNYISSGSDGNFTIEVDCDPCLPPIFALTPGACDTAYMIDVEVISTGSAGKVNISNDGGAPAVIEVTEGTYPIGPFSFGSTVEVKVADSGDPTCVDSTSITLGTACPPANDDLCNAIPLTVGDTALTFTNTLATGETNEPEASCWIGLGTMESVWFSFEAPASGQVLVTTDFATPLTDTHIGIYGLSGSCTDLTNLTEVGCDEDGGEVQNFNSNAYVDSLTPSTTYYVQVDGYFGADGEFKIQVIDACGYVFTTQDSVAGSLRAALVCGDTVRFIPDLAGDTCQLGAPLTLSGSAIVADPANIHVQSNSTQAIVVAAGPIVYIEGLSIIGGTDTLGSALDVNSGGAATINDVDVFSNGTTTPVRNNGTLNVQGDSNVNQ